MIKRNYNTSASERAKNSRAPFADGVLKVYVVKNDAPKGKMPVLKLELKQTLRFERRIVGMGRHYAALQAQVKIEAVLRVPRLEGISARDIVICDSGPEAGKMFRIEQIQHPLEFPLVMDITLTRTEERYELPSN